LNVKYLRKNSATDVIAVDFTGKFKGLSYLLAEIFVSTDTAIANARIFKTSPLYEIYLYLIHGALHLLGYDDKTARQKQIMRKKEKEILRKLFNHVYP
jgi:rRNA maturation RNase YbeY